MKGLRRVSALAGAAAIVIAASAFGAIQGTTHKVPGTFTLEGVGCGATGPCVAVGQSPRSSQNESTGVFVQIKHGKPGTAHQVAGTNDLSRISCPQDNYCIATGYAFSPPTQKAIFVVIRNGVAGKVHDLGMQAAASIGCGSASSCWAFGDDYSQNGVKITPMLVHLVNAKVTKTFTLTGSYSFSAGETGGATPFCPSAMSCITAGTANFQKGPGVIFSMDNGKVKVLHQIKGTTAISGLFCASESFCRMVGYKLNGETATGDVVTLGPHGVGKVHTVNVNIFPLACASKKSCFTFGGVYKNGHSTDYVIPITGGDPGTPEKMGSFVSGATCQRSLCLGVGGVGSFPTGEGSVFSFTG